MSQPYPHTTALANLYSEAGDAARTHQFKPYVASRSILLNAAEHLSRIGLAQPDVAAAYCDRLITGISAHIAHAQGFLDRSTTDCGRHEWEREIAASRLVHSLYAEARATPPAAAVLSVEVQRIDGATDSAGCKWAEYSRDVRNEHTSAWTGIYVGVIRYQQTPRTPRECSIWPCPAWQMDALIIFPDTRRTTLGSCKNYDTLDEALAVAAGWRGLADALLPV